MSTTILEATTLEATDFLTVPLRTPDGGSAGTVELPAAVFDVPLNMPLLHQVVVAQRAAARQGTSDTKTRGEVRGGGKKPYRQKGTGRARQGSTRAPQFVGGGTVHGPTPRSYDQRTPKKMKAAALRGALSDRARNRRVHVLTAVVDAPAPSTRTGRATLEATCDGRQVLAVLARGDETSWLSLRNLAHVHLLWADQLNTYDVLVSDDVVFTQGALEAFLASSVVARATRATPAPAAPVQAPEEQAPEEQAPEEQAPEGYGATAVDADVDADVTEELPETSEEGAS